jgi:signal peptidase I, bacterial type
MKKFLSWTVVIALSVALVAIVAFIALYINVVGVFGESMQNTLQSGDFVMVENFFYNPQHGDIVMVHKKDKQSSFPIVKRVIAVAGDTINLNRGNGEVYLNGTLLNEPYIAETMSANYGNSDYPQTVPENHIFVMGDNRNHSEDSRHEEVGMVEKDRIIGKVIMRILPLSSFEFL